MSVVIVIVVVLALLVGTASAFVVGSRRRVRGPSTLAPPASGTPTELAGAPGTGREAAPEAAPEAALESVPESAEEPAPPVVEPEAPPPTFRERMSRTRNILFGYLGSIRSKSGFGDDELDSLEEALIRADVGVALAEEVMAPLRRAVSDKTVTSPEEALAQLRKTLVNLLSRSDRELKVSDDRLTVWLMVGVNGVGKTTTIGKLSRRLARDGKKVYMAAGDTFRAAAADQLSAWAERTGAGIVRGAEGADPASVVFDAIQSARAKGADVLLADTAGRLHNKSNLMDELAKVRRVADKEPGQVTETLLVLDATTGQNGLTQAREFAASVGVTGVVLTKLDGTAKGGIVLAIEKQLGLPVKLVGLGEGMDDLIDFDAEEFVGALLD
jgi:fused signal recognition particle receptor